MAVSARAAPVALSPPGQAVAAAIVATTSEFWSEAAELWFDLALWRPAAPHAWPFAAEAALRCGDLGLADQMLARRVAGSLPEWLAPHVARMEALRVRRIVHFASGREASIEELLDLGLYRDAIRSVAADAAMDDAAMRDWLIRAHHGLGEHDVVVEIAQNGSNAPGSVAGIVEASKACMATRAQPLAWHREQFVAARGESPLLAWLDA